MVEITIQAVNLRYNNGEPSIQVQYNAMDHDPTTIAINGFFQLTEDEYDNNRTTAQLVELVRNKITEKVKES